MRRSLLAGLAVFLLAAVSASAQGVSDYAEYRVGPKDLLEIKVSEVPELNIERRVTEAGTLELPLLGEFPVQGLTASEVRDRLEALLTAKLLNRADVSVSIKEFGSKPITLLGAVGRPGPLPISGRWSLLRAITGAGGLSGGSRRIIVLRTADNGLSDTLTIDSDLLFRDTSSIWNIPIIPGDIVNVPLKSTVTVYCLGEVKTAGPVAMDSDEPLTILTLIAKVGGLTDRASHTLRIKRKNEDGKVVEFRASYNRILSGKDPDFVLKPGDIIIVKESFL